MNQLGKQTVCVMGLGYIGLPTATVIANSDQYNVVGYDINKKVVDSLANGKLHISEPLLDEEFAKALSSGNLLISPTIPSADIYIIAVPTPFLEDKKPDLSYIKSASQMIASQLSHEHLIILESTSPPGATESLKSWVESCLTEKNNETLKINYAYCPERIIPGNMIKELVDNDRVIGGHNHQSTELAKNFYSSFINGQCHETDSRTAELVKLTENSFRDVNIAFANELSLICEQQNVNAFELIRLSNHHPRVNILQPGVGVGGHCIAVDPWFLVDSNPAESNLIKQARVVNDSKPVHILNRITDFILKNDINEISLMGLSFKPDIDDLRESPALQIAKNLIQQSKYEIKICEPNITELPPFMKKSNVELVSLNEALKLNTIVFLVAHSQFKSIEKQLLENKTIFDPAGIFQ